MLLFRKLKRVKSWRVRSTSTVFSLFSVQCNVIYTIVEDKRDSSTVVRTNYLLFFQKPSWHAPCPKFIKYLWNLESKYALKANSTFLYWLGILLHRSGSNHQQKYLGLSFYILLGFCYQGYPSELDSGLIKQAVYSFSWPQCLCWQSWGKRETQGSGAARLGSRTEWISLWKCTDRTLNCNSLTRQSRFMLAGFLKCS